VLTSVDGAPDRADTPQRFLDDKGTIDAAGTDAYYAAINAPATLAEFDTRFLQRDLADATYYNAGDLGIGREMRCGRFTATGGGVGVACAVSNYGTFGGAGGEALSLAVTGATSGTHSGSFATVAMAFVGPVTAPNAVQFFVYGADGKLVNRAVLDTHGDNQAIPNNCLSCHASNASYDPTTHAVTGARFLPFDPAAFAFADVSGFRRTDQEGAFRALNALVWTAGASAATREMLTGFYHGDPGTSQLAADTAFVPAGWQGALESRVYTEAIAPYCRGCHASRGDGDNKNALDLSSSAGLIARASAVAQVVCSNGNGKVKRMPDAEVTQHAFWSGRARAYLAALIDLPACTPR